jgi:hypothetical protein
LARANIQRAALSSSNQSSETRVTSRRFRRLAGWGYGNLPDIAAVVVLDRIVDDLIEQFGGQHVEVVQ